MFLVGADYRESGYSGAVATYLEEFLDPVTKKLDDGAAHGDVGLVEAVAAALGDVERLQLALRRLLGDPDDHIVLKDSPFEDNTELMRDWIELIRRELESMP